MQTITTVQCEACQQQVPCFDMTRYGSMESYRDLCTLCLNAEIACDMGLEWFEDARLEPVQLLDCAGETHTFHFRLRLLPSMIVLDGFEVVDGMEGGYRTRLVGDPEDEVFALVGRLVQKLRRQLAVKHLGAEQSGLIANDMVRGEIGPPQGDYDTGPVLTIDGKTVSWQELGALMNGYEGFQFKLEIKDLSDEF